MVDDARTATPTTKSATTPTVPPRQPLLLVRFTEAPSGPSPFFVTVPRLATAADAEVVGRIKGRKSMPSTRSSRLVPPCQASRPTPRTSLAPPPPVPWHSPSPVSTADPSTRRWRARWRPARFDGVARMRRLLASRPAPRPPLRRPGPTNRIPTVTFPSCPCPPHAAFAFLSHPSSPPTPLATAVTPWVALPPTGGGGGAPPPALIRPCGGGYWWWRSPSRL